ncbi:hypothetical protein [Streptomyces sp. NRRL S-350]|uniref:hypothetical protein n=1 Tax=Streptomyces sp. NRRL S-350 TaxID=1463902 RepID=UPI0004BE4CD8|nr:hypothetical protein [Streptomyces sp. NRRL S-350]
MTDTALAVESPLRRAGRLDDRPAAPGPPVRTAPGRLAVVPEPEPGPAAVPVPVPAGAHDRGRPAHCRIAMHFED